MPHNDTLELDLPPREAAKKLDAMARRFERRANSRTVSMHDAAIWRIEAKKLRDGAQRLRNDD
jgi:hypothetical protein